MPHTYSKDIVYVCDFCNGNVLEAQREYARRFPNRKIFDRRVFSLTFNRLRETGLVSFHKEGNGFQAALRADLQQEIVSNATLITNNPETSIRRASAVLRVLRQTIWRTLKGDNRYPYYFQKMQNLLPEDCMKKLNFSNWFLESFHNNNLFISIKKNNMDR